MYLYNYARMQERGRSMEDTARTAGPLANLQTMPPPYTNTFIHPVQMNLELTTRCPLKCPQCYVHLNTGKELALDQALYWLGKAKEAGISNINLSGGETLCYSHLTEVIAECRRLGLCSAVALSGIYADRAKLRELIDAGVNEIYISLNGSTEEINKKTRDAYHLAVRALKTLQEMGFRETFVNWVMHEYNADDLPQMMELCESYGVQGLVVLGFKPDSKGMLKSFPTLAQLEAAAKFIKSYKGTAWIAVEPCFSTLRAIMGRSALLGNLNRGVTRGCGAGRDGVSINVDGYITPCRHLDFPEEYTDITEYWNHSEKLRELREIETHRGEPCRGCKYEPYCLPCPDTGCKLYDGIAAGFRDCPVAKG